ncbi:MAG: TCP-1/cpn60 chaperonin family protein [Candidatus Bathyarchaeota archaeon]|nr:TCP-1/cpn60 chaperonin family protein [Candidatus Bathyarchaeota archaeon]MDW8039876.1 thermosome subunit beta [Nitrososphaerota archaeon]
MAAIPSGTVPVLVLKEGTGRTTGREAQRNNITAAKIISELVKTTLGPRGMDKMLVSSFGDVTITNDGATILKEIDVQHPAAKMLVEVAKAQDNEVGDGTTTAAVLAGELLAKAEELLDQNIHPTIIIEGFKKASEKAREVLEKMAMPVSINDDKKLLDVAMTSMGSKGIAAAKEHFAKLAVEAVRQVAEEKDGKFKADIDLIKILKKHGKSLEETELVKGMVIDKEVAHPQMPKMVCNAKIALLNAKLEIEKTEFDAKINIESPEQMKLFLDEEERMLREMVDKIAEAGANVVLCEKGIDDVALHFLAKRGILAVKNISSSDMEKLARATGGKIVASVKDLTPEVLGEAKLVEEVKIGDDKLVYIRECKNPKAVTIVVRGGTEHVVDEAERSLHDALCVVRNAIEDGKIVPGGGAPEAEVAKQLRDYAVKVGGREQLAIEAFADAIESIPLTLAENAGLDPVDIMVSLRAAHEKVDGHRMGVDVFTGKIRDMLELNVVEPLRVKLQVVKSATEAANMILKIDDVIAAKGIEKEKEKEKEKPKEPSEFE